MGTTGRYAQQQITERNRRVLRKHRWRFGLMALAVVGVGFSIWLIAPGLEVPLWAVVPATFLCVAGAAWDQLVGTYNLVNGRDAEKWTSKELRKVCGPAWHVVDGLPFDSYDVDHVLVGPGGVYVVETKYTDSSVDLTDKRGQKRAQAWIGQAQRSARHVTPLLKDYENVIYPIVVVWGSDVTGSPLIKAGVPVLKRRDLAAASTPWRRHACVLADLQVRAIVQKLVDYRDEQYRQEYERSLATA